MTLPSGISSSSARPQSIFRTRFAPSMRGFHWRLLIATRNRLIHGYLGLDDDVLWSIIEDDVPALLVQLRALKAELQ